MVESNWDVALTKWRPVNIQEIHNRIARNIVPHQEGLILGNNALFLEYTHIFKHIFIWLILVYQLQKGRLKSHE